MAKVIIKKIPSTAALPIVQSKPVNDPNGIKIYNLAYFFESSMQPFAFGFEQIFAQTAPQLKHLQIKTSKFIFTN